MSTSQVVKPLPSPVLRHEYTQPRARAYMTRDVSLVATPPPPRFRGERVDVKNGEWEALKKHFEGKQRTALEKVNAAGYALDPTKAAIGAFDFENFAKMYLGRRLPTQPSATKDAIDAIMESFTGLRPGAASLLPSAIEELRDVIRGAGVAPQAADTNAAHIAAMLSQTANGMSARVESAIHSMMQQAGATTAGMQAVIQQAREIAERPSQVIHNYDQRQEHTHAAPIQQVDARQVHNHAAPIQQIDARQVHNHAAPVTNTAHVLYDSRQHNTANVVNDNRQLHAAYAAAAPLPSEQRHDAIHNAVRSHFPEARHIAVEDDDEEGGILEDEELPAAGGAGGPPEPIAALEVEEEEPWLGSGRQNARLKDMMLAGKANFDNLNNDPRARLRGMSAKQLTELGYFLRIITRQQAAHPRLARLNKQRLVEMIAHKKPELRK